VSRDEMEWRALATGYRVMLERAEQALQEIDEGGARDEMQRVAHEALEDLAVPE
jgi:hypothetical protein